MMDYSVTEMDRQRLYGPYRLPDSGDTGVRILRQVAEHPGDEGYNPLFLYGSGKTHLLRGAVNCILEGDPRRKVVHLTGEQYVKGLIQAVRAGTERAFRDALQDGVDVLVLEEVQHLAGKERAQEVFFHLFDELYERGTQIILTADRRPQELRNMEERVICQFSGGIQLELQEKDL